MQIKPRATVLRDAVERSGEAKHFPSAMLTVAEACQHLRISKWTLYRLIQGGKLPTIKIGSRRLISTRSIHQFIERLESDGV